MCGKCSLRAQNFTIKKEKELHIIERKLKYNKEEKRCITEYPWIRDPAELPDNRDFKIRYYMASSVSGQYAANSVF